MKRRYLLASGGVAIASAWLGQACQAQEPAPDLPEASKPAIALASSFSVAMAELALAFLQVLEPEWRDRVVFPFESEERFNWHYTPRSRQGISLKNMNREQQQAAENLLQFALSETGYRKVQDIFKLETVLRQQGGSPAIRDPELYFWTVFGEPGTIPWGWRVEGHHLSLNIAIVSENAIAATPAFWGANPAEVAIAPHRGLRALAREQDLAFELLQSLSPQQQAQILIRDRAFGDIVAGPGRAASLVDPVGLPLGEIETAGRDRALRLLDTYVENLQPDLAAQQLQHIRDAGVENIRFAWAGSLDKERGHYYRLHGPTALIEFDNSRNNANHIHSVWHDLTREFAVDALGSHYEHFSHDRV